MYHFPVHLLLSQYYKEHVNRLLQHHIVHNYQFFYMIQELHHNPQAVKHAQHSITLTEANELTIHVPATQTPDTPHEVPSTAVPFSTGSSPGRPHISLQG